METQQVYAIYSYASIKELNFRMLLYFSAQNMLLFLIQRQIIQFEKERDDLFYYYYKEKLNLTPDQDKQCHADHLKLRGLIDLLDQQQRQAFTEIARTKKMLNFFGLN